MCGMRGKVPVVGKRYLGASALLGGFAQALSFVRLQQWERWDVTIASQPKNRVVAPIAEQRT
jgi:hypothetical protein